MAVCITFFCIGNPFKTIFCKEEISDAPFCLFLRGLRHINNFPMGHFKKVKTHETTMDIFTHLHLGLLCSDLKLVSQPFLETSVEHRHLVVAKQLKQKSCGTEKHSMISTPQDRPILFTSQPRFLFC